MSEVNEFGLNVHVFGADVADVGLFFSKVPPTITEEPRPCVHVKLDCSCRYLSSLVADPRMAEAAPAVESTRVKTESFMMI